MHDDSLHEATEIALSCQPPGSQRAVPEYTYFTTIWCFMSLRHSLWVVWTHMSESFSAAALL